MSQTLKPPKTHGFWASRARKLSWNAIPNVSFQKVIYHFRPQVTGQMNHVAPAGYKEGRKLWKNQN